MGRGRGGRSKKRGGKSSWGKAARGAGKDAAKSIGTSMAEDAAWCAVGDPLNVVGCNSGGDEEEKPAESSSWWSGFAQTENDKVDSIVDQVGNLTLDEVWDAGSGAWNMLPQTDNIFGDAFDMATSHLEDFG